jgi:uncharacterized repeat protein (TIGR01451 family)
VVVTFSVSNTGNAVQDYALTHANLTAGAQTIYGGSLTDNFDVTLASCTVAVNGTPQAYVANLAPGASATVTVACPIASNRVNNDLAGISLTAQAATAGSNGAALAVQTAGAETAGTVDIVFADGAGSDDADRDGKGSARSSYRVVTASLLMTKTFAPVCDPLNGSTNPKNIPGAYVQYTVTIANGGATPAILTTISDTLSSNVDFDPDLITGAGAATNCVAGNVPQGGSADRGVKVIYTARGAGYPKYLTSTADGDGGTHAAGVITIDFANALPAGGGYVAGELRNGESMQLVYQVRIK